MKRIIRRTAALVLGLMLGVGAWAGLEVVTHISDLNASWPLGSDLSSTSDDHIRNIKTALKTDFPNINAAVTATPTQLNTTANLTASGSNLTGAGSITASSFIPNAATVPANGIYLPSANTLGFSSNTTARGSVNSTGNWALLAPSSGIAITATTVETAVGFQLQGPNTGAGWTVALRDTTNSVNRGFIGVGTSCVTGAAVTDLCISPGVSGRLAIGTANGAAIGTTFGSTGTVTINAPSSGLALFATGIANSTTARIQSSTTSGQGFGLEVDGGTTSADTAFTIFNAAGTSNYFQVRGDGVISGRGLTAAALVDMTPDKSTFTGTLTGMTAGTTGTVNWVRMGNLVTIYIVSSITGTSNATTMTMTGLPAAIQPTNTQVVPTMLIEDNTVTNCGGGAKISGSTITFFLAGSSGAHIVADPAVPNFNAAGTKGLLAGWTITYAIQ